MRTLSKTVPCPMCGQPAVITLSEEIDPVRDTEDHRIELDCDDASHRLDEPALVKLWASDRAQI